MASTALDFISTFSVFNIVKFSIDFGQSSGLQLYSSPFQYFLFLMEEICTSRQVGDNVSLLLRYYCAYTSLAAAMVLGLIGSILFIIIQVILLVDIVDRIAEFLYIFSLALHNFRNSIIILCSMFAAWTKQNLKPSGGTWVS